MIGDRGSVGSGSAGYRSAGCAARTVGLSVRALHAGFRRELDQSPKQYLQQTRLDAAHTELVATDPSAGIRVIDIAHRWGFSHPGRFAATYRDRYGEPPAATLAAARI